LASARCVLLLCIIALSLYRFSIRPQRVPSVTSPSAKDLQDRLCVPAVGRISCNSFWRKGLQRYGTHPYQLHPTCPAGARYWYLGSAGGRCVPSVASSVWLSHSRIMPPTVVRSFRPQTDAAQSGAVLNPTSTPSGPKCPNPLPVVREARQGSQHQRMGSIRVPATQWPGRCPVPSCAAPLREGRSWSGPVLFSHSRGPLR
jgi:hypothetical protein